MPAKNSTSKSLGSAVTSAPEVLLAIGDGRALDDLAAGAREALREQGGEAAAVHRLIVHDHGARRLPRVR